MKWLVNVILVVSSFCLSACQLGEQEGLVKRSEVMSRPLHPLPDFKSMTMDEAVVFFSSGNTDYPNNRDSYIPNVFPDSLKTKPAKTAALEFVKANMNQKVKQNLTVADSKKSPPSSGWIVFSNSTNVSYSFIRRIWAINLEKNICIYCSSSGQGGVGSNALIDEERYDIRTISLTPAETKQMVGVLWWLNQIKTVDKDGKHRRGFGDYCSADGSCYATHVFKGKVSEWFSATWWRASGLRNRWGGSYNSEVCANFCNAYCAEYIQKYLADRWGKYDIGYLNLYSSIEEKLNEKHSKIRINAMKLELKSVFKLHQEIVIPVDVLEFVINMIGDIGLIDLKDQVMEVKKQLKPKSKKELEYRRLEREFNGAQFPLFSHKPSKEQLKLERKYDRKYKLYNECKHDFSFVLRSVIDKSLLKIRALGSSKELRKLAMSKDYIKYWAQMQLRRKYPIVYKKILLNEARNAKGREKKQAISLLVKLAPKEALILNSELSQKEKSDYCVLLFPLYKSHLPTKMQEMYGWITEMAKNTKAVHSDRRSAVRLLVFENFPKHEKEIYVLLSAIIREKEVDHGELYDSHPYGVCIQSLVTFPKARARWQQIIKLSKARKPGFMNNNLIHKSLVNLTEHAGTEARREVVKLLEYDLINGGGQNDSKINDLLKYDFRESLPLLERLATLNSKEKQHERAYLGSAKELPLGNFSYHAARHVRALWMKHDPDTLAKLLAAKALNNPEVFIYSGRLTKLGIQLSGSLHANPKVRKKFHRKIQALESNQRKYLLQLSELMKKEGV